MVYYYIVEARRDIIIFCSNDKRRSYHCMDLSATQPVSILAERGKYLLPTCMYICMCMYVCTHVCMYVCMYVCKLHTYIM